MNWFFAWFPVAEMLPRGQGIGACNSFDPLLFEVRGLNQTSAVLGNRRFGVWSADNPFSCFTPGAAQRVGDADKHGRVGERLGPFQSQG